MITKIFFRNNLRLLIFISRMTACQSLLVATYFERNGGYQWQ